MVGALCTYAVAVYWIAVGGCTAAVLLGACPREFCVHARRAGCRFQRECDDGRVDMSEATFAE